jgi:hypothetical protein
VTYTALRANAVSVEVATIDVLKLDEIDALTSDKSLDRTRGPPNVLSTGEIFSFLTGFTALRFTAPGPPFAARRMRILPVNQRV